MADLAPNAQRFEPLPAAQATLWGKYLNWNDGEIYFSKFIGLELEELRRDYARVRMPYRPELRQRAGVVQGGAIATLVDTVVVPAVGSAYEEVPRMVTVNMLVQYLSSIVEEDAVAEGWVVRRGRSTVFCRAEVRTGSGALAATGDLVYQLLGPSLSPPA